MEALLKQFYTDEHTRDTVQSYLIQFLNDMAVKRVMKREPTDSLADANEVVLQAFIKLKEDYGNQPKSSTGSSR